jgi:hypothetical protein
MLFPYTLLHCLTRIQPQKHTTHFLLMPSMISSSRKPVKGQGKWPRKATTKLLLAFVNIDAVCAQGHLLVRTHASDYTLAPWLLHTSQETKMLRRVRFPDAIHLRGYSCSAWSWHRSARVVMLYLAFTCVREPLCIRGLV